MQSKSLREHGQALVIIALAAIGLVGMVGLAIDGSAKFSDRRHAQNAADAAALEGALTKLTGLMADKTTATDCSTAIDFVDNSTFCQEIIGEVWESAETNGYDGMLSSDIDVYTPPISGPYDGNADYVQVIVTSTVQTYFARIVGFAQTTNTVEAVAYLKEGRTLAEGAMLVSYDPDPNCSTTGTGGYSISVSGGSEVNLHEGGIMLNSDEVCGFVIPNCADLNIYDGTINSVGNNIDLGSCSFDPPFVPNTDEDPIAIPADVYWPDVPAECGSPAPTPTSLYNSVLGPDGKWHEEWLIHPGYYTDFPPSKLIDEKRSYIYMESGVYCIDPGGPGWDGDLSWSPVDAAFLNGSTDPTKNPYTSYNPDGVTLYIKKSGGFTINTSSPTYLDATNDPDSDYQGYLIILEGTHTAHPTCTINGGADIDLNGLIFAPYCDFIINGKAGETAQVNAQLIGWTIKINGANTINFNYDPSNQVHLKRKVGLMR